MKRVNRKSVMTMVMSTILSILMVSAALASDKSDGAAMKKVLKSFKAGKYTMAEEYAGKLPRYAQEQCVTKMSRKMKKAYKKVVKSYKPKRDKSAVISVYDCVQAYYLTDVNNDNIADLMVVYGSTIHCKLYIYTYKKGKVIKIHEGNISNDRSVHAYPNHKGIVYHDAKMGGEELIVMRFGKTSQKWISYGSRMVGSGSYLGLGFELPRHTHFSSKKGRMVVEYSALS